MRQYLGHVAMLLLGVTLTVGFYEGRRVVKTTARAFTAATSVSTAANRRGETEELRDRLAHAEEVIAARKAAKTERKEGKEGKEGKDGKRRRSAGDDPADKMNNLRARQRLRLPQGRPTAAGPLAPGLVPIPGGPPLELGNPAAGEGTPTEGEVVPPDGELRDTGKVEPEQ